MIEPEKEKGARAVSRKAAAAFDDTEDGEGLGVRQGRELNFCRTLKISLVFKVFVSESEARSCQGVLGEPVEDVILEGMSTSR